MRIFSAEEKSNTDCAKTPFVSALVVAAGNSTRMGGVNKQFLTLGGAPVLVQTLLALAACPLISEIVVAARETDIPKMLSLVREYAVPKVKGFVRGGATRADSVCAALALCAAETEYYAIHDGARPLVSQTVLENTIQQAFSDGAAATGVRVKDTIKVVDATGKIVGTPDRATLWAVHTPQVFASEAYRQALQTVPNSSGFTDDCKLMEAAGYAVTMVAGSYENIKITTPEDMPLAETIWKGRQAK